MKKALFIFLLTAAVTIAAAAQSDFDEPKWTKHEPPKVEFSINFPAVNIESARNDIDGSITGYYHTVVNKTFFTVFSENQKPDSLLRQLASLAVDAPSPREVEIDGLKGERYDFKGTDDYEHSYIAIQAPANFYIFDVISETRGDPMIEEFLGSIRLNRTIDIPEKPTSSPPSAGKSDVLKSSSSTYGKTGGFGAVAGKEMGRAPQPLDPVAPPKYAKVDSPVTVLSKPQPVYTELARRFQLSGTVKLRVVFEKKGEIGAVTVISKMPLGLTQSAISAARRIRFSPAMRKGDPYAVAKVVEYNFTLY